MTPYFLPWVLGTSQILLLLIPMNQSTANLLKSFEHQTRSLAVARIEYPIPQRPLSLIELLEECDRGGTSLGEFQPRSLASEFRRKLQAAKHAASLAWTPIIGVCGTVNSGKSTLVSSFLSESGRQRILIGELGEEGTHRFVFWLPAKWKHQGLDEVIEKLIGRVTGCMPELLADNPEKAAEQYNARQDRLNEFMVPLLAYDTKLDESGIALLDCPDIQRSLDDKSADFTSSKRLELLKQMVPLCSAFVVVVSQHQSGSDDVGRVFKTIGESAAHAPLYYVHNMTATVNREIYLKEATSTLDKWQAVYNRSNVKRIYLVPHAPKPQNGDAHRIDVCSAVPDDGAEIEDLSRELNPAEMQEKHLVSSVSGLSDMLDQSKKAVDEEAARKDQIMVDVAQRICRFIENRFVSQKGDLRALSFNEAARRLAESIRDSAPLPIKIALKPGEWLSKLRFSLKKRDATPADEDRFAHIKSSDFADFMEGHHRLPISTRREELDRVYERASRVVLEAPQDAFMDAESLRQKTDEMWRGIPFWSKVALLKNVLIALAGFFVAGCLAPIDGGATIVIWTKYHMVLGGWEILAIVAGGPLLGMLVSNPGARKLVEQMEREVAKPQLSRLYAGLADGLGIPRYHSGSPVLRIAGRGEVMLGRYDDDMALLPVQVPTLTGCLVRTNADAWQELRSDLEQLKK